MTLYLGFNQKTARSYRAHHLPILTLCPYAKSVPQNKRALHFLPQATHIILTSPSSAQLFLSRMTQLAHKDTLIKTKEYLCLGVATKERLLSLLPKASYNVATQEIAEGFLPLLEVLPPTSRILYPHSALARPVIKNFLYKKFTFFSYSHYTVRPRKFKKTFFSSYKKIIFTSPSTVRAFAKIFPEFPEKIYWCQGPITFQEFQKFSHLPATLLVKASS
ncbi:uroporphyrinogen-III synthase,Uroporphyrinogen-III synthase,Uroporphyrinogen-III synthase HemD [Chlamydia serpentis]|uniref:Uroporphyrinogen-III synthase,Uroporphyrinogen-III synthase,Uroporphyrinogen-III synthase HemD n=1 Tax=Chlamydia serpentis TaxID=1967782 RepID=A0A2R8FBB9_9CHLA|nr:uroporphyrinogen-III synthase [Chlamydia serpentis]SPN73641.1 uroporphyrinogen-III synthase,Uroporphyrinogen-III synthase,Uroporphyrinogen-III synthase HemD [Chlamydia serpentis]